jgi:hypothetical protein
LLIDFSLFTLFICSKFFPAEISIRKNLEPGFSALSRQHNNLKRESATGTSQGFSYNAGQKRKSLA